MKKEWGLLPKILSGEKTIESRWLKVRAAPWGKVAVGDRVYFKNSGEPITVVARVSRVSHFNNLNRCMVEEILNRYGREDGLGAKDLPRFFELFKDKRYCVLIFLKNPRELKPFEIDKSGFGMQAAWLCVGTLDKVKR